ncbi:MAG: hypothetical protein V2J20_03755 [Wenzhouxiangella sp.]|jgi:uncharacterized protein YeaC (DUF1315 family)|nr:hypothetical protein [Wenzhouxiangella sp.]
MEPEQQLQNDEHIAEEVGEVGVEDQGQHLGDDSAPSSEPQHEENSADADEQKPVNQEAIDAAIARQHAKYREEQRKRMALEEELQRLRQASPSYDDPEPKIVEVDPYADDVQDLIKQRDESLRAHMAWQQRQRERQAQQSQYEQQRQLEQQQTAAQQAEQFFGKAAERKIDQEQLNQAVQTVGQYQLGHEVASYLMGDDKGPELVTSLSKNPVLLAELSMMSPTERILHIERNVRTKLNPTPRASSSKPPPTRVKGRAADASDRFPLTGGKVTVE